MSFRSGSRYSMVFGKKGEDLVGRILDSVNSGIIIIDHHGLVVYANNTCENLLNVSFDAIKGKQYAKAFAKVPAEEQFTLITLKTGQEFKNIGCKRNRFNNLYITTDTMLLKNDHGDVIGAAGIFKDITDIYELHQQLQESNKASMLGHMAAGMANDILNPLTTAKGFTQILMQKAAKQNLELDEAREYLQIMLGELETINRLVQDFIKAAKFKPIAMKPVDLNSLVYQTTALIANQLNEKTIYLELDLGPKVTTVGDEVSLKQAVLHLLDNALDILSPGGKISISTRKDGNNAYLMVADNGPGITEENLEIIFTPFFSTYSNKRGMGLAITHRIIHSHKGHIKAESQPGMGTCWTISLPLAHK